MPVTARSLMSRRRSLVNLLRFSIAAWPGWPWWQARRPFKLSVTVDFFGDGGKGLYTHHTLGHQTSGLVQQAGGRPVIGADQSFFGLYVAKRWIAPAAEYVCCAGHTALPFPDGAFSAVFCSDAFQYFLSKATSTREFKRLTQDQGTIVLFWVRNGLVEHPYTGLALPPAGYQALVADMPHRLVADSEVLARYLRKQGPPLGQSADLESLASEPVLPS